MAVLGSTGSIGVQALEIIRNSPSLELHSIFCGSSADALAGQIRRYGPGMAGMAHPPREGAPEGVCSGPGSLRKVIEGADMVLNAIVGSAGLEASLAAREMGIPLALANKESLVIGGELLDDHLEKGLVIPVDSEHSTVFRCLAGEARPPAKILLTASGGALRDMPLEEVYRAPVERVLAHPNWEMGSRITVDSASMVNKAFEVIEARKLFPGIPVGVVVHPESIVHSLVETADGAWKALMGLPDMGVPISFALHWPDLPVAGAVTGESPTDWGTLSFRELDEGRYPAFTAVMEAFRAGGTAPAAANAADEEAVGAFLAGRIPFGAIAAVIAGVVREHRPRPASDYETIIEADAGARVAARRIMEAM